MLNIALKEWAIVCDLLLEGRLAIVLRKGGISEWGGPGVFALEYQRFALWPSWAHQQPKMIKEPHRDRVVVLNEPDEVTMHGIGEAAKIWRIPSREAFDQLEDLHCWTKAQIDMRFDYKPDRPIYLLAVRAATLAKPKTVRTTREYTGCRSWVPLTDADAVDDAGAKPALDDEAFARIVARVDEALQ